MTKIFTMDDLTILVIDDTSMMRAMHLKHLKSLGIDEQKIIVAEDGEHAIRVIAKHLAAKKTFDLIVCDWDMPKITGIDFLNKIKAISSLRDIKFLMVTARGEKKDLLRAIQSGVDGYIIKPFKIEAYAERIMSLLAKTFVNQ